MVPQGLDERALAHTGNARDAYPVRLHGVEKQDVQQLTGLHPVVGPGGLDQGQGPANSGSVGGQNPLNQFMDGHSPGPDQASQSSRSTAASVPTVPDGNTAAAPAASRTS